MPHQVVLLSPGSFVDMCSSISLSGNKGFGLRTITCTFHCDGIIAEQELKETDVLSELMAELGQALPELKRVLIDKRDTYLSEKIKEMVDEFKIINISTPSFLE